MGKSWGGQKMSNHKWRFFRAGGFDQVLIDKGKDLISLVELDQKLWAVLSCPVKDLEFDHKTLKYLDSDNDGHIRVPEVLEAVSWTGTLLKDPDVLVGEKAGLPLDAIDDSTEYGKNIKETAKEILKTSEKENESKITIEDTDNEERIFSQTKFNGDGIITPDAADDEDVKGVINDIIECLGAETDRSGKLGISSEKLDRFFEDIKLYNDWFIEIEKEPSILITGEHTKDAYDVYSSVRDKIDDFFARCSFAKFDKRSL